MARPRNDEIPSGNSYTLGTEVLTERDFLIPIKDSHGHSDRVSLRVHPAYMPVLNSLLRAKVFPIRSTNDIVRLGIDRVCKLLEKHSEVPSVTAQVDAMREVLAHEESMVEFLGVFESMSRVVDDLTRRNAEHEAARIVSEMRQRILMMPTGYWRGRYEDELMRKFGHLVKVQPGQGAGLGDSEGMTP